eukprot:CAMPEP_0172319418 /NCGR_PEP_ID=MMETSP1058-20130122/37578_1 /TAXON_ID=83371 /ORGANISM="Detonula confervacea, Strain CCMP 353" /LENGTH=310 /DNA_ID=CAMNT_0013034453 /DNA_START=18 /DNA_END=950 /DNA_ORIENTATION=-
MVEEPGKNGTAPAAAAAASPSKSSSDSNANAAATSTSTTAATKTVEPSPPDIGGGGENDNGDDEDMLLVTEFPPPPYYYTMASRLTPPEIPHRAFRVAAKRVMMEREKAREESERIRIEAEGGSTTTGGVDGGGVNNDAMDVERKESSTEATTTSDENKAGSSSTAITTATDKEAHDDDDSIDPNDPNETVVAVFGEIVEDPTLVTEEECHDPVIIRENVKRLNRAVLNGFLRLVQKLVHDPNDNKKLRDELSHNLFLMLQECNKFREHQAREILIKTLEQQLEQRKEGLALLRKQIDGADAALMALHKE